MNCEIRTWRTTDAADLAKSLNNKKIHNNLRDGLPLPYTESDALEYINAMLAAKNGDTFAFAITVDDKAVGSIGVFRQSNIHNRTAEMGYYVAEPFWGKGIATTAVELVCRIFAEPFAFNSASCRILEKNGFVFEGVLRQNAVKNGVVVDMNMYSILKKDFEKG